MSFNYTYTNVVMLFVGTCVRGITRFDPHLYKVGSSSWFDKPIWLKFWCITTTKPSRYAIFFVYLFPPTVRLLTPHRHQWSHVKPWAHRFGSPRRASHLTPYGTHCVSQWRCVAGSWWNDWGNDWGNESPFPAGVNMKDARWFSILFSVLFLHCDWVVIQLRSTEDIVGRLP